MSSDTTDKARILGSLGSSDGKGVVRVTDRFATDVDDLWAALTDPQRLSRWIGDVDGDLRLDGDFRGRFFASEWEGTGRVAACEPPHRFLILTRDAGEEGDEDGDSIEATLTSDGDHTILVIEERGMPLDQVAAYGAGVQIHVEDLGAHLVGRDRCDAQARWAELLPGYQNLPVIDR